MPDVARDWPSPLRRVGRYEIGNLIGRGGTASVYEAVRTTDNVRAAVKILHPHLASDRVCAARFLREARTLSQIVHPNIVRVLDAGHSDGMLYLAMSLVEGEDLSDYLLRLHPIPLSHIVECMLPVVDAVATAHEAGVIHRDLKPRNVRITRSKHGRIVPQVLDFGLSKWKETGARTELTTSGETLGTVSYMSPEQLRSARRVDERTDVYALGVMLYECATARRPFQGLSAYDLMHDILTGDVVSPGVHRPDLPAEFEEVMMRAMRREPSERYGSARELQAALSTLSPRLDSMSPRMVATPRGASRPDDASTRDLDFRMVRAGGFDVALWLHTARDPRSDEWTESCSVMAEYMRTTGADVSTLRALVVSDGGAPNVIQRKEIYGPIMGGRSWKTSVVTGILTESAVKRGIATAVRWFNPKTCFFEPHRIRDALTHVDISPGDFAPVWRALMSMQRRMRRIETLGVIGAQLDLAFEP